MERINSDMRAYWEGRGYRFVSCDDDVIEGGFSSVHRVERGGRAYALKVQDNEDIDRLTMGESFVGSAVASHHQLCHENVIPIVEEHHTKQQKAFCMPFCKGGHLEDCRPTSEREAAGYFHQVLKALRYLHSKRITHNDVKLTNIVREERSAQSRVYLIDLDLLKVVPHHIDDHDTHDVANPNDADMNVELCHDAGGQRDPLRVETGRDIFAAGVSLIELLSCHENLPERLEFLEYCDRDDDTREPNEQVSVGVLMESLPGLSSSLYDLLAAMLSRDPLSRTTANEALTHPWFRAHLKAEQFAPAAAAAAVEDIMDDGPIDIAADSDASPAVVDHMMEDATPANGGAGGGSSASHVNVADDRTPDFPRRTFAQAESSRKGPPSHAAPVQLPTGTQQKLTLPIAARPPYPATNTHTIGTPCPSPSHAGPLMAGVAGAPYSPLSPLSRMDASPSFWSPHHQQHVARPQANIPTSTPTPTPTSPAYQPYQPLQHRFAGYSNVKPVLASDRSTVSTAASPTVAGIPRSSPQSAHMMPPQPAQSHHYSYLPQWGGPSASGGRYLPYARSVPPGYHGVHVWNSVRGYHLRHMSLPAAAAAAPPPALSPMQAGAGSSGSWPPRSPHSKGDTNFWRAGYLQREREQTGCIGYAAFMCCVWSVCRRCLSHGAVFLLPWEWEHRHLPRTRNEHRGRVGQPVRFCAFAS